MLQQATIKFLKSLSTKNFSNGFHKVSLASVLLALIACGSEGERPTVEVVVEKDKVAPTLNEFTVTNKCNFTPRVALDDTIIVRIDASESLMKPVVTILGEEVDISGQHHEWEGEFVLSEGPVRETNEVVAAKVIDFVKAETSIPDVVAASIFTSEDGLGLSSEQMVSLVTAMEGEFGLDLPDPLTEPGKINTVQQVVNSIQNTELEIPVTVSFQDISGEVGSAELIESKKLKFCEQNCSCFPDDISGTWENRNAVNAMGVGPAEGDTSFWNINNFELGRRSCVFDDEYYFGIKNEELDDTGTFGQFMGDQTWLEDWMSPDGKESCGVPVAPWDGSGTDHTYIWDPENKELTVKGVGAHIGIPRIQNESNAGTDGSSGKIVYNVATASTCILILDILGDLGNWWHFELEKIKDSNGEPMTPEKCAASSGGSGGSSADITTDTDGDGVPDAYDMFPNDASRTIDTDMDGIVNEDDDDDDGDGFNDQFDCAPLDASVTVCTGSGGDNTGGGNAGSGGNFDLSNASEVGPIAFENQFGGALIAGDGSYSVPTGSEVWAGFSVIPANATIDVTPFTFGSGGKLTFKASVAGNANADVRFRFEKAPANGDDVTPTVPSYTTESKTLSGVTETEYTVTILPQGSRTFGSLILYIDSNDIAVSITDVMVSTTPATAGEEIGPFAFTQVFGGSTIPADDTFISTGTDPGGFAVVGADTGIDTNPLYFGNGGLISFIGSVNGGGSVGVKFEVQADVYPNVQPNYVADVVTVSGPTPKNYSVSIPGQYDNGFKNVVVYLEDLDTEVVMKEIMIGVTEKGDPKVAEVGTALFTAFEGAAYDEETSTFNFPSSGKSYAGFANINTDLFPFTFDNGGCVTFNASAETDVRISYKFERQPWPNNTPEIFTDEITISGTTQEYTVDIPVSASAGDSYSSFLLFINKDDRDLPVVVTDVVATNTGACGS